MDLSSEAADYLDYGPMGADRERISPEQFAERTLTARELPENLRRVYFEPETSEWVRTLPTRTRQITAEQAQELASVLGEILRGETSAASLQTALGQRLGAIPAVVSMLVREVTRKFITPNYFQIAQVYEKKHGKGTPLRPAGFAGQGGQQATGSAPPPAVPPRIVDLRNGAIPSRLPPPAAPLTPAPPPRPQPPKPAPPSPPRTGPSADDLLDNLGKRPAPPPFVPPPGGGTHGPLPPDTGQGVGGRV